MPLDADSEVLIVSLMAGLEHNIPVEELEPRHRRLVAEEFIETIGALIGALGEPGPGKVAALLYLVDTLGIDRMSEAKNRLVVTLVESMKVISQNMKAARDGTDPPPAAPSPS